MTTSQSRKIRDPVASNTDLAGSIVSKQARQKRTKDGTLDLNGSRRNLRTRMGLGITKDPTSRFLTAQPAYARSQSGRNDLQGGSGVGTGLYAYTPIVSNRNQPKGRQGATESFEPNQLPRASFSSKQSSSGRKQRRAANGWNGSNRKGGKRGNYRRNRRNGYTKPRGGRSNFSSSHSFNRSGATDGGGSVWGPIQDAGWNLPAVDTRADRSLHCSADISF